MVPVQLPAVRQGRDHRRGEPVIDKLNSLGVEVSFEDAIRSEPERLAGQAEQMAADPGFQGFAWRHWSYLARGRYAEQLERLYELFPPSQVLVDLWQFSHTVWPACTAVVGLMLA